MISLSMFLFVLGVSIVSMGSTALLFRRATIDRGYETDLIAWENERTRVRKLPWHKFEGVCSCGFVTPLEGDEFKALASAEVLHFLEANCDGSLVRRELTRARPAQKAITVEDARRTLLRLCEGGMTMEEAADRMGGAAKLAAFPLAPLPSPDVDLFEKITK